MRNVEDVDMNRVVVEQHRIRSVFTANSATTLVIVARDNLGRLRNELSNSLKDVLWRARRKIGDELVVDG